MPNMTVPGAVLIFVAFTFHVGALVLLIRGARWLGRQRRLGYPDARAQALDRRSVLIAIGAVWIWTNSFVLIAVSLVSSRL